MLAFFLILLAVAAFLELSSLHNDLRQIGYELHLDRRSCEPKEEFQITSTITNRRRLPVSFLRLEEHFPRELIPLRGESLDLRENKGFLNHCSTLFLMPRQILDRRITASLPARGRYIFRGAELFSGDFLGLREVGKSIRLAEEIVIYPPAADMPELEDTLGGFLGEISVQRFLLEDPVLTLGFREYTGREPQRSISWPQSLSRGRLMVKNYDYTQDASVTVVLNTDYGRRTLKDPRLIEETFSLARSVCAFFEEKRIKYSFLTNATAAGNLGCWSLLAEGLGSNHFYTILEGLGRATYDHTEPCQQLFYRAERRAEQGQAHIVITPKVSPNFKSYVSRLKALTGCPVCVLTPNTAESPEERESLAETDTPAAETAAKKEA